MELELSFLEDALYFYIKQSWHHDQTKQMWWNGPSAESVMSTCQTLNILQTLILSGKESPRELSVDIHTRKESRRERRQGYHSSKCDKHVRTQKTPCPPQAKDFYLSDFIVGKNTHN